VREDHPLDRQVGECREGSEEALGVRLDDEDLEPAAGAAQEVAGDEGRVLADQEHDVSGLPVELDRLEPSTRRARPLRRV
jgi:hypothetical protein